MSRDGSHTIILTRDQLRDILTIAVLADDGRFRLRVRDHPKAGPDGQEIQLQAIVSGQVLDVFTIIEDLSGVKNGEGYFTHRLDKPVRDMRFTALEHYGRSAPAAHDPARDVV